MFIPALMLVLTVTPSGDCPSDEAQPTSCLVPATVVVRDRRSGAEVQRLELESVLLTRDDGMPARWRPAVIHADFDFDGQADVAIADTEDGPYGGPTYAVLLWDASRGQYAASEELSSLTRETLGLFTVDARRRRLVTMSKSGCCHHWRNQYTFAGGVLTLVDTVEDDATFEDHRVVTHGRFVGGKWRTTTRRTGAGR